METKLNIKTIRELWQQTGEQHWLALQGTSMLPFLHEGDEVRISHDLSAVRRGDILVFQKSDSLVAHRIVGIYQHPGTGHQYLTKGDNCSYFDPPLQDEAMLGRVTAIRRNAKERSLTTPACRFWNSLLAGYHWSLGTFFRVLRPIVHVFRKKNS